MIHGRSSRDNDSIEWTFDDVSLVYVRCLRILGLLPFEGRDSDFIGTRILLAYFTLSSVFHVSTFVCFCYNTRELTVEAISETVLVVGVSVRFYILGWRRYRLHRMLRECASLWSCCSAQGRRTVVDFERKFRKLFQLFVVSACVINVLYPVNALVSNVVGGVEARTLPYRWYADDMEEHWPGYWTVFFVQMFIVQNSVVIGTTCDATLPLFMILSAGYLRHVRDEMLVGGLPTKQRCALVRCTVFHQRILKFCAKINKLARTVLLLQVLSTGYNISLMLVKLVSSDRDKYKYVSILMVYVVQLYLCQWTPDHLFDESLAVSTAAYFASVYWMPRRMGKHLLTIIARAQHPVQITAGGFVNLSLQSFGSMLTSAFSFFTLLRKLNL